MVRTGIFVIGILLAIATVQSTSKAQAVEQGTIIIDPYYGFPLFGEKFAELVAKDSKSTIKGIGPVGGRVEYMVSNRLGLTMQYIHKSINVSWSGHDKTGSAIDSTGYLVKSNMLIGVNLHLAASNDVLDMYISMAAGTNIHDAHVIRDSQSSTKMDVNWQGNPFAIRVALGARYYFTNIIGVSTELGIGGPLVTMGASIKF